MTNSFRSTTVLLTFASIAFAAVASVSVGAQPNEDPKSIVDRIYSVPQAERGEARFKISCSSCHTPSSFAGGAFADRWSGQTMAEAFEFVSNAMPENDPGGLKKEDYADVLAFILRANSYPAGADDLPTDTATLKKYEIVPNPK